MNDPVEALESLVRMRERGLITDDEYQAKRAEVLARVGPTSAAPTAAPPAVATPPAAKAAKKGNPILAVVVIVIVAWILWPKGGSTGTSPQPPGPGGGGATTVPAAAAFSPITLSGSGAKVASFTIPASAPGIAVISASGSSNFVVESLASDGSTNDLLVNEIGRYAGTVLFDADAGEHSVAFKVDADGSWTITVKPITSARTWSPSSSLSGAGDDVLRLVPAASGLKVVALKHSGESNFAIWGYGSGGSALLVNEIGSYSGETTLGSGTSLVQVTADGSWSMTPR